MNNKTEQIDTNQTTIEGWPFPLPVKTYPPADDGAKAQKCTTVLHRYKGANSPRGFVVRSLWVWPHGRIESIGAGLAAAYDDTNHRMTILNQVGERISSLWFEDLEERCFTGPSSSMRFDMPDKRFFSDGRIFLKTKNDGFFHLFDEKLNLVSDNDYIEAGRMFDHGVTWARKPDGRCVVVDTAGTEHVPQPHCVAIRKFTAGVAPFSSKEVIPTGVEDGYEEMGNWGLIDGTGKVVVPSQFPFLVPLGCGLFAAVRGECRLKLKYPAGKRPDDWDWHVMANKVYLNDARWGVIDSQGRTLVPFEFTLIKAIVDRTKDCTDNTVYPHLFFVQQGKRKWRLWDARKQELLPQEFIDVPGFPTYWGNNIVNVVPQGWTGGNALFDVETLEETEPLCETNIVPINHQQICLLDDYQVARFVYDQGQICPPLLAFSKSFLAPEEIRFCEKLQDKMKVFYSHPDEIGLSLFNDWQDQALGIEETKKGWHLARLEFVKNA